MKELSLIVSAFLFIVPALCSADIRLFYTANKKTFEVAEFENGAPKIGEVRESGDPASVPRHK